MVYLDYSATTKPLESVLETYNKVSLDFFANPNSLHDLGLKSKKLIDQSLKKISIILNIDPNEIIFTSGATESNNTAIKGIAHRYKNRGNHIITTKFEHSSVLETVKFLENNGYTVDYVSLDENGIVDLDELEKIINDKTILVSIGSVSSELGISQPIDKISKIIKEKNKRCFFHCDITQSIGKTKVDFSLFDLASFSSQKFFGPRGIGVLYLKKNIELTPLIHGGKSTNDFRSGTPNTALIASMTKALSEVTKNYEENYNHVLELNEYLIDNLNTLNVRINSNNNSIPHIVNFSLNGIKAQTMVNALSSDEIYVSAATACNKEDYSEAVYALTNDLDRAKQSIRVSLSYQTTKEEIDIFIKRLKYYLETL